MVFQTAAQAEDFIFSSYMQVAANLTGPDAQTRHPWLARRLLDELGQPDRKFSSILVTGSKGKGSIALLTAKLLQGLGYRVGLVTSPHLLNFRERIRLGGRAISEADFIAGANRLEDPARQIMAELREQQYLSPAGLILGLAALYFADNHTDFVIIEAGRGGRYDDCVVLDNHLALFGPILLEHAAQLGPTVADIARNKVALLKPGGVGLSVPQSLEVQTILESHATNMNSQLFLVGRQLQPFEVRIEGEWLRLGIQTRFNRLEDLALPIPALYESENLAVALEAVEAATGNRAWSGQEQAALRETLRNIHWPGRMQTLAQNPLTVADCAVNGQSARSVLQSLAGRWHAPVAAIIGVPTDRDWRGVLQALSGHSQYVIFTEVANNRLAFPAEAADYARQFWPATAIYETSDFRAARELALRLQPAPQLLLILGTQSVIGAALREYGGDLEQL